MSIQSDSTFYTISLADSNGNPILDARVGNQYGMDDATWLNLIETLRDFPWPTATRPIYLSASKSVSSQTYYLCDTAATPLTFN
ncbi:hypothetical protein [Streptomyces collinus]